MTAPTETEVKIRLSDTARTIDRIGAAGFHESVPRVFEANTLYDTPERHLRQKEMLLRLREVGDKSVITWKGPGVPGRYKSRTEIETTLGSAETMAQIFHRLGYEPSFRYEKFRTEFTRDEAPGVITVDETPIGSFLELEGAGDWIDQTAAQLGFSPEQYILDSYGTLYIADCERRGVLPAQMVFASTPGQVVRHCS